MSITAYTITEISRHVRDGAGHLLDVRTLAAMAGMGAAQFSKAFRRATGLSPTRYLHEVRVEESKKLMVQPDASLTDVAAACGFSSQPHFNRAFKAVTGITPSDYLRGKPSMQCMLCPRRGRCGT